MSNFCVSFPDANIPLSVILGETEFEQKIKFFQESVLKDKLNVEILPKTNDEVINRISKAFTVFDDILKKLGTKLETLTGTKLSDLIIETLILKRIEQAIDEIITDFVKTIEHERQRNRAIQQTRIVEAALVRAVYTVLESKEKIVMFELLKKIDKQCVQIYVEYGDRFSSFLKILNAKVLVHKELWRPRQKLADVLSIVRNPNDVELLSQAVCRMFQVNLWGAIVTADYSDIFHKRDPIYTQTLLTVCDPLYLLNHLDGQIQVNIHPQDEARKIDLRFGELVTLPTRPGHIA